MIQLLGDYGPNILSLYRSQVRKIEKDDSGVTMGNPFRRSLPFFLLGLFLAATLGCSSAPPPSQALADAYYDLGNAWV